MPLVSIRSSSRQSGTSTDFTVKLPFPIVAQHFCLKSVILPNSIYNITSDTSSIDFTRGATAFTASIAPGSYTVSDLTSALQTSMNASDANTYVVTYSSISMRVTISAAAAFVINSTGTMNNIIGYSTLSNTASATTHTASGAIRLHEPLSLAIFISELGGNIVSTENWAGGTFIVPLTISKGGIMEIGSDNTYHQNIHLPIKSYYSSFSIKLKYADNSAIDLNHLDWELLMEYN